jgi:hypothetical protein
MEHLFGDMAAGLTDPDYVRRLRDLTTDERGLISLGLRPGRGGFEGYSPFGLFGPVPIVRRGPTLWDRISNNELKIPLEQMHARYRDVGHSLVPEKRISPEDFEINSHILKVGGDRTIAGKVIESVNGVALENPVLLNTGFNSMRGRLEQKLDNAVWSSAPTPIRRLSNTIRRLGVKGDPVYINYAAMGPQSSDSARTTTEIFRELMKTAPVTRKGEAEYDEMMRSDWRNWRAYKNWRGIRRLTDEDIIRGGGALRTKVAQLADTAHFAKQGIPDMASIRRVQTEDELLSQPTGVSGYAVARMDPTGRVINHPQAPNRVYFNLRNGSFDNTQIAGTYLGRLTPVPARVAYPDWFATRDPNEHPWITARAFHWQTVVQRANQQWVDGYMNYLRWMGLTLAGAVAAGLLTQQQADDIEESIDRGVIRGPGVRKL